MTSVPPELRDTVVRRLEAALAESNARLREMGSTATELTDELQRLVVEAEEADATIAALREDVAAAREVVEGERRGMQRRIAELDAHMARHHAALARRLEEERERARAARLEVDRRITALADDRKRRDEAVTTAADERRQNAETLLRAVHQADVEAMDCVPDLGEARARLTEAEAMASGGHRDPRDVLAAAESALLAASALEARVRTRKNRLRELRHELRIRADRLLEWVDGAPETGHLPDQREAVRYLVPTERQLMSAVVEQFVARAADRLNAWNGHGARLGRLESVADVLEREVLAARRALPAARAHEDQRYFLDWLRDELLVRFGRITERNPVFGIWADPADRKSDYSYVFETSRGEVIVRVPWEGPVVVMHNGRAVITRQPPTLVDVEAVYVGRLKARWSALRHDLTNPGKTRFGWDDIPPEVVA